MKTLDAGASRHSFIAPKRRAVQNIRPRTSAKYWISIWLLVLATVFWGFGNVAQKIALDDISPAALLTIRSVVALFCLIPFAIWECRRKGISLQTIWRNWVLLLVTTSSFALGLSFQTFGGQFTSATNLGFIVNLCVLITPLLLFVWFGERISKMTLISCLICFVGAGLLTGLHLEAPNFGDVLCLMGAMFYAVWIIAIDRALKKIDAPILITTLQFVPTVLLGLALAENQAGSFTGGLYEVWPALLFVSLLSTCVSFLIAAYAQRFVKPVIAAIIYSFEALFGAVAAFAVLGERLSPSAMLGGGLMFVSILACQYRANSAGSNAAKTVAIPVDHFKSRRAPRESLGAVHVR
jgi:drug/metabolite transporter (DMT)-like permease